MLLNFVLEHSKTLEFLGSVKCFLLKNLINNLEIDLEKMIYLRCQFELNIKKLHLLGEL